MSIRAQRGAIRRTPVSGAAWRACCGGLGRANRRRGRRRVGRILLAAGDIGLAGLLGVHTASGDAVGLAGDAYSGANGPLAGTVWHGLATVIGGHSGLRRSPTHSARRTARLRQAAEIVR